MESIKLFNGLNGATVSRQDISEIIECANVEEQFHIAKKLETVLTDNEDANFIIEIVNPGISTIPQSMLNGLQFDDVNEFDVAGLNKAVSSDEIYQMVTDKIIEALEQPLTNWEREWSDDVEGYALAYNFVSKKVYRSVNQIILNPRLLSQKYPILKNPYFMTFKQVSDLGGKVKKDSKGHVVTYYSFLYSCVFADINVDFRTYDREKFIDFVVSNNILARLGMELPLGAFIEQSKTAFLKYYKIFNGVDIEGIDFDLENFDLPGKLEQITNHHEKIDICEQIIANYPAPKPAFTFGGSSAHFVPAKDVINMPNLKQFKYVQAYYTTYFHEIIHSTGLKSRLDRDLTGQMKTQNKELKAKYAFEELIAEIGAMFLCSQSGILHFTLKNSLAYVKGWRNNLIVILKEDNKFVFRAATQSQKAVDYLLENFEFVKAEKVVEKPKKVAKIKVKNDKITEKEKVEKPAAEEKESPKAPTIEEKPVKVDANGQTALFGAKNKTKLNAPAEDSKQTVEEMQPIVSLPEIPTEISKYRTAVDRERENQEPRKLFNLKGDLAKFLGKIEIKPVQSLAITLDSGEGGGKTHTLYNWANEFFKAGYRPIIWSLEEHAASSLSTDKAEKYFGQNKAFIPIESENENETSADTIKRMFESVKDFDVIMIDSWAKVMELDKKINFDQDLRKAFNGKLFIVVFQRTSSGEMRGGSKGGFDGDVILKVEVDRADFRNNFIYNHKNRYNDYMPISELKYSPYHRALQKTEKEIVVDKPKLSFDVAEIN